ncbi:MAG: hypothetical protein AAGB31_03175 [Bdellovibrio sp.]
MEKLFIKVAVLLLMGLALSSGQARGADSALSFAFELTRKEYLSQEILEYPLMRVNITRSSSEPVKDSVPFSLKYLNQAGVVISQQLDKISLKDCKRAAVGEKCVQYIPALQPRLLKETCQLQLKIAEEEKFFRWGQCQSVQDLQQDVSLSIQAVETEDEDLLLDIANTGQDTSAKFRLLLVYIDHYGTEISYRFINQPEVDGLSTRSVSVPADYLYSYTCGVKVFLDPDDRSKSHKGSDQVLYKEYGDCLNESFVPYADLSLQNLQITSSEPRSVLISADILNAGDVAITGRALETKLQILRAAQEPVVTDRAEPRGFLGPKETLTVQFVVPEFIYTQGCDLRLEVNFSLSLEESNRLNNILLHNYCNQQSGGEDVSIN